MGEGWSQPKGPSPQALALRAAAALSAAVKTFVANPTSNNREALVAAREAFDRHMKKATV